MADSTQGATSSLRHQYTGQHPSGPSPSLLLNPETRENSPALGRNAKEQRIKQNQDDDGAKEAASNACFEDKISNFQRKDLNERLPGLGWWPPKRRLQSSDLCPLCRAIDFEAAFTTSRIQNPFGDNRQWYYKYELDFGITERDPSCQFCQYLVHALSPTWRPEWGSYTLIFHNEGKFGFRNDEVLIKVIPSMEYNARFSDLKKLRAVSHTIICHRNRPVRKTGMPQIVSPVFDSVLARSWLDTCKGTHTVCGLEADTRILETKLIDCYTRKLVATGSEAGDGHSFVALSYVWGACPSEFNETGNDSEGKESQMPINCLPLDLPLTIEDAITVTITLGFQYLWVDQYCTDQADHVEKSGQISQMDLIYKCADLTIIAAAGDGCHYGLPGVSACRRDIPDPFVLDGSFTLGINPRKDLEYWKAGSWHTRGWTFQEALFSRRRLVFSDAAMYYECKGHPDGAWQSELSGGVECESYDAFHVGRDKDYGVSGAGIQSIVGSNNLSTSFKAYAFFGESLNAPIYHPIQHKGLSESFLTYTALVGQYTTRSLTYASDGLNAFRGVANALQHFDHPVFNISGVPFVVPDEAKDGDSLAVNSFMRGLAWRSPAGGKRPHWEFPSWCWANVTAWGVTWNWNKLNGDTNWWIFKDTQEAESARVLSEAVYHPHDVYIEFDPEGNRELLAFTEFAKACRNPTPLSQLKGNPTALCFKSGIFNSTFTWQECCFDRKPVRGSVCSDLGYGPVAIGVHLDVASAHEQGNETVETHRVLDSEIICSTDINDERLYTALASGGCSLVLLRFDDIDALALLVEWVRDEQDDYRKTARRVGICRFYHQDGKYGWSENSRFIRCFAGDIDLRLV